MSGFSCIFCLLCLFGKINLLWDDTGLNIVVQDKGSMIVKCRINYKTGE